MFTYRNKTQVGTYILSYDVHGKSIEGLLFQKWSLVREQECYLPTALNNLQW